MPGPVTPFLQNPDQPARRAELAIFLGPNPASFLALYDRMTQQANNPTKLFLTTLDFSSAAFFLGPVWFFYRKLWTWASAIVVLMTLIAVLPTMLGGYLGLPLSIAVALLARRAYIIHAIRQIAGLHQKYPDAPIPHLQLRAAGGVSRAAGWASGILFFLAVLAAILNLG